MIKKILSVEYTFEYICVQKVYKMLRSAKAQKKDFQ